MDVLTGTIPLGISCANIMDRLNVQFGQLLIRPKAAIKTCDTIHSGQDIIHRKNL